jgi:hypothetical protein
MLWESFPFESARATTSSLFFHVVMSNASSSCALEEIPFDKSAASIRFFRLPYEAFSVKNDAEQLSIEAVMTPIW